MGKRRAVWPAGLLLASAMFLLAAVATQAQSIEPDWSEAERVWAYEDVADAPFTVADHNRTVHAMNSRTSSDGTVGSIDITYRQWRADSGWTEPIDVVLSPKKDIARIRGLMLSSDGFLNMVFYGGDEQDASMYFTVAPAAEAGQAHSWSAPAQIAAEAGPINDGAMTGDDDQNIFVVYTSDADGMGAYAVYSLDGGISWAEPVQIHRSAAGQWPTAYTVLLDSAGRLHVAWTEADATGNGKLLYYSRLDESQAGWTQPRVMALAEGDDLEVDTAALVEHDGRLIMVYHDSWPTTRFMRTSDDGGETWTEPRRLFEQVGSNGPASFAKDSAGALHMFFGGRLSGQPDIHGMWHSVYQNGTFAPPAAVASGPQVKDEVGGSGFDPQFANAIVVQGNTILLTWDTDPGVGRNGVHFSTANLGTPALAIVPLPASEGAAVAGSSSEVATPTAEPAPEAAALSVESRLTQSQVTTTPMTPLLYGMLPVAALIGLALLWRTARRSGR